MESDHVLIESNLVGAKLSEIQKISDEVRLVFKKPKINEWYVLAFKGLLFETSGSSLNKQVKKIQFNDSLGFRVTSQLHHLNKKPEKYRQLFIQMAGSDEDNKMELIGASTKFKLSLKKPVTVSLRANTKSKEKAAQK